MALIDEHTSVKKIVCLHVLINKDQTYSLKTVMKRAAQKLDPRRKDGAMSQGEWAQFIVENAEYPVSERTAQNVLSELIEKDCMEQVDERLNSNKPVPLYKRNRDKIYQEIMEGDVSQQLQNFWQDVLMTTGEV